VKRREPWNFLLLFFRSLRRKAAATGFGENRETDLNACPIFTSTESASLADATTAGEFKIFHCIIIITVLFHGTLLTLQRHDTPYMVHRVLTII
jgi:hypothetical protein